MDKLDYCCFSLKHLDIYYSNSTILYFMKRVTLAEAGEREFIRSIRSLMQLDGGSIIRSAGDDCAEIEWSKNEHVLTTIDTFVEGIHFKREYSSMEYIGLRCMTASVSDIAAMAGYPVYSVVSLSMPPSLELEEAYELFRGLQKTAQHYECPIIGGETTSTLGPITVTVTIIGKIEQGMAIYRTGARVGDSIFVTGTLGDAMAGLFTLERKEQGFDMLQTKFITPRAHVHLARLLTHSFHLNAMIDISDGLGIDLGHICEESGCGADIWAELLPLSDEFLHFTTTHTIDRIDFAVSSGEEFELLFTSSDPRIPEKCILNGHTVTKIGTVIEPAQGINLHRDSTRVDPLAWKGYEHFTS